MRAAPSLTAACSVAFLALGCGPAEPNARTPASMSDEDLRPLENSFMANEAEVLGALGRGDPRFALRVPKVGEDDEHQQSLHTANVRAESLVEAKSLLDRWPGKTALVASTARGASALQLERELLERTVVAEAFRVEEEKDLPRAGSEIVRGIILVGADPAKAAWVTRRLEEIRLMLRPDSLTSVESAELDDSLDPLERSAAPGAQAAIAILRVALAESRPAPPRAPDPKQLEAALRAHLGVAAPLADRKSTLTRAEVLLRHEVRAHEKLVNAPGVELAETHAEELLSAGATRCTNGESGSVLRGAVAPPERWATCHAIRALASTQPGVETLTTLIALHDGVTVALWAMDTRADGVTPDRASENWRLLAAIPPERQARLLRAAVAHPVTAIATGLAISMMMRDGLPPAQKRAQAWLRFGDAPFDIVEREGVLK